jgi:hypothetical protein
MVELSTGRAVGSGAKFDQAQARCQNDELAAIPIPAEASPPDSANETLIPGTNESRATTEEGGLVRTRCISLSEVKLICEEVGWIAFDTRRGVYPLWPSPVLCPHPTIHILWP